MTVKRRGRNQPDDDGGAGKGNTDFSETPLSYAVTAGENLKFCP